MKKILCLILTASLALGLFAGCSARNSAPSGRYEEISEGAADTAAEAPVPYPEYDYEEESAPAMAPAKGSNAMTTTDGGEQYAPIYPNGETATSEDSLITFSLKVDTASYSNAKRYIENGELPPADAIRTEEFINYFNYNFTPQTDDGVFAASCEIAPSPYNQNKLYAMLQIQTKDVDRSSLPPANLVFLIDTSGSMSSYDKLPLLKEAFYLLTDTLTDKDKISIIAYDDTPRLVLNGVSGSDKDRILRAVSSLHADGSTGGERALEGAYEIAQANFISNGENRIILATDGDFNVGISGANALSDFIKEKRDNGIYLSVLGFGEGNLKDDALEALAKDGDGNYFYIDSVSEAEKVLVDELGSNLYTLAEDVKAQIEFNPDNIASYRLIGYENRKLDDKDFKDDKKDAGEVGVGTQITVLLEIELNGENSFYDPDIDMKYGGNPGSQASERSIFDRFEGDYSDELLELRVRYKNPKSGEARQLTYPVTADKIQTAGSDDFNTALTAAEFAEQLRDSQYAVWADAREMAMFVMSSASFTDRDLSSELAGMLMKYAALR